MYLISPVERDGRSAAIDGDVTGGRQRVGERDRGRAATVEVEDIASLERSDLGAQELPMGRSER